MRWTDIDHSFCEEHILGLPEYYNSISSLFIVGFGLYGLMNIHNELFIDIMYACLAIVGIGSTGYHWYGNIGWALCDETPIVITVFSGIIYADNVHFLTYTNKYLKSESDSKLVTFDSLSEANRHDANISNSTQPKWVTEYMRTKKYKLFAYLGLMHLFMVSNVMENYRLVFPQLFTCVVAYLFYKINHIIQLLDPNIQMQIKNKVYNSFITVSVSGLIWTFTEISCKHVKYHIFLLGHPMWHFFIGHGFYNLIQAVYYIKLCSSVPKYSKSFESLIELPLERAGCLERAGAGAGGVGRNTYGVQPALLGERLNSVDGSRRSSDGFRNYQIKYNRLFLLQIKNTPHNNNTF